MLDHRIGMNQINRFIRIALQVTRIADLAGKQIGQAVTIDLVFIDIEKPDFTDPLMPDIFPIVRAAADVQEWIPAVPDGPASFSI